MVTTRVMNKMYCIVVYVRPHLKAMVSLLLIVLLIKHFKTSPRLHYTPEDYEFVSEGEFVIVTSRFLLC